MQILVIEDDPNMLSVICGLLPLYVPAARIVEGCATLAAAKTVLAKERIDLILSDIHLPDGTGFDLIEGLQTSPQNTLHLPSDIVLMTGNITIATVQAALLSGAVSFLSKPFTWSEVSALVRTIAEKRGYNPAHYQRSSPLIHTPKHQHNAANNRQLLHIQQGQEHYAVPIASICYVEADDHSVIVHTEHDEQYSERVGLKVYKERLRAHGFVQPHKSYLVALRHIKKLESEFVVLKGGAKKIPITRGNAALVKQQWLAFDGG